MECRPHSVSLHTSPFKLLIFFQYVLFLVSDSSLHKPRGGVRFMKKKAEDKLKIKHNAYLYEKYINSIEI